MYDLQSVVDFVMIMLLLELQTTTGLLLINPVTMENLDNSGREVIVWCYRELTTGTVSKHKWDAKEDTGKSMKNALAVTR